MMSNCNDLMYIFESVGCTKIKTGDTGFYISECGDWLKQYICNGGNLGRFLSSRGLCEDVAKNCWFSFTNLQMPRMNDLVQRG